MARAQSRHRAEAPSPTLVFVFLGLGGGGNYARPAATTTPRARKAYTKSQEKVCVSSVK